MLEAVRYRLLMLRLRAEIARTVRGDSFAKTARTVGKPTCKVCESIV